MFFNRAIFPAVITGIMFFIIGDTVSPHFLIDKLIPMNYNNFNSLIYNFSTMKR